ncbi:hypothetical protein B0J11DRAFT_606399 [Dendryphion nanum]|uniref:Uncharacterized protein n=1 Tax=Dendryphion nanum TaxID=256645 RepID=A0A9P9IK84_9PLEO|nr:hypothetical protein B0J11DRAFT_606399 [Dendryphion nanum]
MNILTLLLFLVSFAFAIPVPSPIDGDIIPGRPVEGRPVEGRPVEGRPVEGRPVTGRPVEPRPIGSRNAEPQDPGFIPNSYIVEFKAEYTHAQFKEYLVKKEVTYTFTYEWTNPKLYYGVSIKFGNGGDYLKAKEWIGIKNIHQSQVITIDPPFSTQPFPPSNS